MATFIDQLLVSLDLDSKKFEQGMARAKESLKQLEGAAKSVGLGLKGASVTGRQALEETGETGERAGGQIAMGMGRGRFAILALAAAAYKLNSLIGLPLLRRWTQETVDNETETLRMAQSLRLNATELQAWGKTVQLHGGNIQGFNASLEKMEANLGKLGTKVRGAKILEQYLGLSGITDAMVKGKDAFSVLRLFAQQMQGMSVERQFLVGKRLGLDEATIRTLQEGGPAILNNVRAMRELAATNEELRNAKEVAVAQAEANLQWERAKQVIASALLPVLKGLASTLSYVSQFVRENKTAVTAALIGIGVAVTGFALVVAAAAASILLSGFEIATGMTLATGGAWAVGVAVGIAALAALKLSISDTADTVNGLRDAHRDMIDEMISGDQRLAAYAKHQQDIANAIQNHKKTLVDLQQQMEKNAHLIDSEKAKVSNSPRADRVYGGGVEDADLKKLEELNKRQKALVETFGFMQAKIAAVEGAWYASGQAFAMRDPKQFAALSQGLAAAQAKATEVRINTINIQTPTGGALDLTWDGQKVVQAGGKGSLVPQASMGMH